MKRVNAVGTALFACITAFGGATPAQGKPPQDNLIDGERFPDGYTPPPLPQQQENAN